MRMYTATINADIFELAEEFLADVLKGSKTRKKMECLLRCVEKLQGINGVFVASEIYHSQPRLAPYGYLGCKTDAEAEVEAEAFWEFFKQPHYSVDEDYSFEEFKKLWLASGYDTCGVALYLNERHLENLKSISYSNLKHL